MCSVAVKLEAQVEELVIKLRCEEPDSDLPGACLLVFSDSDLQ